jgi:hypothetical protein
VKSIIEQLSNRCGSVEGSAALSPSFLQKYVRRFHQVFHLSHKCLEPQTATLGFRSIISCDGFVAFGKRFPYAGLQSKIGCAKFIPQN